MSEGHFSLTSINPVSGAYSAFAYSVIVAIKLYYALAALSLPSLAVSPTSHAPQEAPWIKKTFLPPKLYMGFL